MLPLTWRHAWKPSYLWRYFKVRRWLEAAPVVPDEYEDERYEERL